MRDLKALPTPEVEELWQAITLLEAQETLEKLKVGVYPKMKASAQRRLHSAVHKEAYPSSLYKPKNSITAKELAERLSIGGKNGRR